MEEWNLGDIIDANKSNKLLIIGGTTEEINAIEEDNLIKGSVVFDETKNEILLNVGTSSSVNWKHFDYDPVGMTKIWPSSTIPDNWLACNGDAISRTTYSDLFDLLEEQYGNGNGSTTFNLPDINNNKFIMGSNGDVNLGVTGGEDRVILTVAELPAHTHIYKGSSSANSDTVGFGQTITESGSTGGGLSHENKPEYVDTQWIIKVL